MKILFLVPLPPLASRPCSGFGLSNILICWNRTGIEYALNRSGVWLRGNSTKAAMVLAKTMAKNRLWMRFGMFWNPWVDWVLFTASAPISRPYLSSSSLRCSVKIIYDFDDAIWLPNTQENKLAAGLSFMAKVKSICKWSYRVSCGNEWLADFARQFNSQVVVNPTTIDTEKLHNPKLFSRNQMRKL